MIDALKAAFIAGYHHNANKLGKPGFNEWFHEKYSTGDEDIKVCRMCDTVIESEEDMYVENGRCHCGPCHPLLYSDEEWDELYNDDPQNGDIDAYYYTTAP